MEEIVLYVDTCTKYMCVGLSRGDNLIYKKQYDAFKRQSEVAAQEIDNCLKTSNIKPNQLTKIVVTNGPGSYTGIRIGLTLAKVMSKVLNIKLVCLSSLQAMCGLKDCSAIIDAKSKRVYYGKYSSGQSVVNDCVKYVSDLDLSEEYVGETNVINVDEKEIDIIENMFVLRNTEEVKDIDSVKAIYLKD